MTLKFNTSTIIVLVAFSLANICYGQKNSIIEKSNKQKGAAIDWKHWKVTLPVGKPTEIGYPEIMDYANNEVLKNLCTTIISMVPLFFMLIQVQQQRILHIPDVS